MLRSSKTRVYYISFLKYSNYSNRKSWDFLSNYVNNAQLRHEKMILKINEAVALMKQIEESALSDKIAREELEHRRNLEESKKKEQSSIYERPQAKAMADSFVTSTKGIFEMCSVFEKCDEPAAKALRMKLKLNINRRTGQITDSLKQIRTIDSELVQLCFESRTHSKNAFSFCLVLLASKLLVNQKIENIS